MWWFVTVALATPGEVTMSLADWEARNPPVTVEQGPEQALVVSRSLTASVHRGLLEGELSMTVEAVGPVEVPLMPAAATLTHVTVDGAPASLSLEQGRYQVSVAAGTHRISVGLLLGEASDRFERAVSFALPPGGPTRIDLTLPEAPIDVRLAHGALTEVVERGEQTQVVAWLDGGASLELAWERRATHAQTDARYRTEVHGMLDLGDDLIGGEARYQLHVVEGELDRVSMELPEDVEVVEVRGDNVLQWHTDGSNTLTVLLRHVTDTAADIRLSYQYPAGRDGRSAVRLPVPAGEVRGALGLRAPVALDLALSEVKQAAELAPRDMPQELLELSTEPIRNAIRFSATPAAVVETTAHVELMTSISRIDELQGISVLMEDGTEVGKLRLSMRNSDRQVLEVELPEGARLTHCYRDGVSLRPAAKGPGRVLVPLTRSKKQEQGQTYTVVPGDTLSGIAQRTLGDGTKWGTLQDANPGVQDLQPGQQLQIPAPTDQLDKPFTLELGWERSTPALGMVGAREVALPRLDLDVMEAHWHVYLPEHVETLTMEGTLDRLSGHHDDPVSRAARLLASTSVVGVAHAGEDYANVLEHRRSSYEAARKRSPDSQAVSAFPLVGQRIRFHGTLLGAEPPRMAFRYITDTVEDALRWGLWALGVIGGLALGLSRSRVALAALATLAVGSWVVLVGSASSILAGSCLGLLGAVAWRRPPLRAPSPAAKWGVGALFILWAVYPALWPVFVGLVLFRLSAVEDR